MEYTESIHDALYTLEYQLIPSYINNDGFIYHILNFSHIYKRLY